MVMKEEDYLKFRINGVWNDGKIDREAARQIDRQNDNHTYFFLQKDKLGKKV